MQINSKPTVSTARPQGVTPGSGLAAAPAPAAPADSVQVGQTPAEPPALTQAKGLIQEALALRTQVGQEFVANVVANTPEDFRSILEATGPAIEANVAEGQKMGLVVDQFWMLAGETRQLSQAAINAENRAEFREKSQQPADRAALFQEELSFQTQADILLQNFPEQATAALQQPAEGEALLTGRTFVEEVYKSLPKDQVEAIQQAAALSPLTQVLAAQPELLKKAASSLAQSGQTLLGVTQGCGQYTVFIQNQVLPREAQAGQLLASLPPQ